MGYPYRPFDWMTFVICLIGGMVMLGVSFAFPWPWSLILGIPGAILIFRASAEAIG